MLNLNDIKNQLPNQLSQFTQREIDWLWHFIELRNSYNKLDSQDSLYEIAKSPYERINYINKLVNEYPQFTDTNPLINQILSEKKKSCIELEHFSWIPKKDTRLINWLQHKLDEELIRTNKRTSKRFASSDPKNAFIYRIDTWNVDKEYKMEFLLKLKVLWPSERLPAQQHKWINKADKEQIEWALEYLRKVAPEEYTAYDYTTNDKYEALIRKLDLLSSWHPADKELFLTKMKKTWSQKKFRIKNKHLKTVTLRLEKSTAKKLDIIAARHNLSRHQVITKLIEKYEPGNTRKTKN